MFSLTPGIPFYKDLWGNRVLFWAVIGGMVSVVIRKLTPLPHLLFYEQTPPVAIYVPGLNHHVFYQSGISWEWGVAFGMSIVFVVWCEVWKLLRSRLYRRWQTAGSHRSAVDMSRTETEKSSGTGT